MMITGMVISVIAASVCPIVVFSFAVIALRPICAVSRSLDVNTSDGQR